MPNIRNIKLVSKREYFKVIKKPTFWLATLFFPVLIVVISLISGITNQESEDRLKNGLLDAKLILVYQESTNSKLQETDNKYSNSFKVNENLLVAPLQKAESFESALAEVKNQLADALIYFENDFYDTKTVKIYTAKADIFSKNKYNFVAESLIKNSIFSELENPKAIEILNMPLLNYEVTSYKDGIEDKSGMAAIIPPIAAVVIYLLLISFSTSYLLMSVSEEKENRMIETILSIIKPSELITGKIFGQVGIILTQVLVLLGLSLIAFSLISPNLPIELGEITVNAGQILLAVIYTILGFLFLAGVMVGVGAATPNYKESQSLSGVFVLLSIMPIYFIMVIFTEPNGPLAVITSYFPFTASMVMLFRNALGEVSTLELIFAVFVQLFYVWGSFKIASKLFEAGALELSQRISLKRILR